MKKVLGVFLILVLVSSAFAQVFTWKVARDFEGVFDNSFQDVWSATVKALMQSKFQVKVADKDAGIISATKKTDIAAGLSGYTQKDMPQWELFLESKEDGVHLSAQYSLASGQLNIGNNAKKQFNKLMSKIAENLKTNNGQGAK